MERNRWIVLVKNYQLKTLLLLLPALLIMEIGMHFYALLGGWWKLKFRSIIDAWRALPTTLHKRREIQRTRRISDQLFSRVLSPTISFEDIQSWPLRWVANPLLHGYWLFVKRII